MCSISASWPVLRPPRLEPSTKNTHGQAAANQILTNEIQPIRQVRQDWSSSPTRMRGTFGNVGTSVHQPSESSDSSSTHNFRGGDCECKQTLWLAHSPQAIILLGAYLFNSKRTVEGQEPKRF